MRELIVPAAGEMQLLRVLAKGSDAWHLVFDNADDSRLQLTPYLPAGSRGHVINVCCPSASKTGFSSDWKLEIRLYIFLPSYYCTISINFEFATLSTKPVPKSAAGV